MSDPLVTYLEDHKAGAGLAIGLLQAMEARHDDESLSQFARSILVGVEEDEKTLQILAKEIGTGSNLLKEAAAWVGEKSSARLVSRNDHFCDICRGSFKHPLFASEPVSEVVLNSTSD
jgi:hypothetical protein